MILSKMKFYVVTAVFTMCLLLGAFSLFSGDSAVVSFVPAAHAQEHGSEEVEMKDMPVAVQIANINSKTVKYGAAAVTIAICALATAMAQSKIGSAGAGVIAERPEAAAMCIVLLAIPETIVILGFVVAAMLVVG